jgi:uroporphyrinogen decarboxylase
VDRRERVQVAAAGGTPDRVPVGAWGHFYPQETSARGLADAMLGFFETYGWDFLKVHARASYHVEDWGFRYRASSDPAVPHVCVGHPIDSPAAWRRIAPLSPDAPALAEQRAALREIRRRLPTDVPVIMTVFSPLDVAEKLVDRDASLLRAHVDADPDAVASALDAIAETCAHFVRALVADRIDGIFFSTKWANDRKLPGDRYARLVRPFDLRVLEEARPLWCNLLHLCEDEVQFAAMADYPVQVFHWDDRAGHNPSLADGRRRAGRAVGGGVDARTLATGTAEQVFGIARAAIEQTQGCGFLLGPGCSVQIARTPAANLHALRRAVEAA